MSGQERRRARLVPASLRGPPGKQEGGRQGEGEGEGGRESQPWCQRTSTHMGRPNACRPPWSRHTHMHTHTPRPTNTSSQGLYRKATSLKDSSNIVYTPSPEHAPCPPKHTHVLRHPPRPVWGGTQRHRHAGTAAWAAGRPRSPSHTPVPTTPPRSHPTLCQPPLHRAQRFRAPGPGCKSGPLWSLKPNLTAPFPLRGLSPFMPSLCRLVS